MTIKCKVRDRLQTKNVYYMVCAYESIIPPRQNEKSMYCHISGLTALICCKLVHLFSPLESISQVSVFLHIAGIKWAFVILGLLTFSLSSELYELLFKARQCMTAKQDVEFYFQCVCIFNSEEIVFYLQKLLDENPKRDCYSWKRLKTSSVQHYSSTVQSQLLHLKRL